MTKGLYFKLNINKERDKIIYNFFNNLMQSDNKIDVLYGLIADTMSDDIEMLLTMKGGVEHGRKKVDC